MSASLPRGVDHEKQVIAAVRDHQVVEDAALLGGEERIALAAFLEPEDVDRHQRLEREGRVVERAPRPGGRMTCPMWLTSKRPAAARVWRCSFRTPIGYCTGIS